MFTCPAGNEVVLIANETPEIVSVRLAVAVSAERLESLTINVKAAAGVETAGMPVIAPLAPLNESPAGKVPLTTDQAYGTVPPLAVRAAE